MRKLAFYARLAMQNLFKNRLFYGPNLLACTLCAALFYIFRFLVYSDMVPQMRGAYYVSFMLELGTIVLAVVMMSILIYANGFIMKRRQKELGLYNILGMEKRQGGPCADPGIHVPGPGQPGAGPGHGGAVFQAGAHGPFAAAEV